MAVSLLFYCNSYKEARLLAGLVQNAINSYGKSVFSHKVICVCMVVDSPRTLFVHRKIHVQALKQKRKCYMIPVLLLEDIFQMISKESVRLQCLCRTLGAQLFQPLVQDNEGHIDMGTDIEFLYVFF